MIKSSEHQIQKGFCRYMDFKRVVYFAIPNGIFLKDKKTASAIMKKMKAEGFKKGVADLFIAHSNKNYSGLFIEMKTLTGRATPDQKVWIEKLNKQGYKAIVCNGLESAIEVLNNYLEG